MKKNMFCPKCGADGQSADSYCKHCGEWLPDLDAIRKAGLFRKRTREEKIRKMRVLEVVSAGLSLTAGALITSVLMAGADIQLLFLAAFCCVAVALYQIVNFYLGYKLQQGIDQSRVITPDKIEAAAEDFRRLSAADTTPFVNRASVVENTTELLEPVPRETKRNNNFAVYQGFEHNNIAVRDWRLLARNFEELSSGRWPSTRVTIAHRNTVARKPLKVTSCDMICKAPIS